jgi:DNA-binding NarL/FixJ family response regulator
VLIAAARAGASAFVVKQVRGDDIVTAVRQVGAEMRLAEKTVKNYVSSILIKLQLSSRTEAAVYAALVFEHAQRSRHDDEGHGTSFDDGVGSRADHTGGDRTATV